MLPEVKERLEGLKYNIDFEERAWENTGGGDRYMSTMEKGVILRKCLNTFVPYCSSPSLKGRKKTHEGKNVRANNAYCVSYKNLHAYASVKSNCTQNRKGLLQRQMQIQEC